MLWVTQKGYYFSADPKKVGANGEIKADSKRMGTLREFTPNGESRVIQTFQTGNGQSATSLAPSAAQVDAAHQATGVPSLGAEAVNYINGHL
jgi:hypothetical protein